MLASGAPVAHASLVEVTMVTTTTITTMTCVGHEWQPEWRRPVMDLLLDADVAWPSFWQCMASEVLSAPR